jgi:hypothetical protein
MRIGPAGFRVTSGKDDPPIVPDPQQGFTELQRAKIF